MHSKLLDTHLYILQHWIIDYLYEQKSISSLKGELIPHLVRRQGVLGQQTESKYYYYYYEISTFSRGNPYKWGNPL